MQERHCRRQFQKQLWSLTWATRDPLCTGPSRCVAAASMTEALGKNVINISIHQESSLSYLFKALGQCCVRRKEDVPKPAPQPSGSLTKNRDSGEQKVLGVRPVGREEHRPQAVCGSSTAHASKVPLNLHSRVKTCVNWVCRSGKHILQGQS